MVTLLGRLVFRFGSVNARESANMKTAAHSAVAVGNGL